MGNGILITVVVLASVGCAGTTDRVVPTGHDTYRSVTGIGATSARAAGAMLNEGEIRLRIPYFMPYSSIVWAVFTHVYSPARDRVLGEPLTQ
jgi:hypothetical protein